MKLRNKKTGAILTIKEKFANKMFNANSLAEINELWEDMPDEEEGNKEHYFISEYGGVYSLNEYDGVNNVANVDDYKQIGNYFDTREQAEKAVEKLKAWKRLKDKNFQFHGHNALGLGEITFSVDFENMDDEGEIGELRHDLDLLFGDEE